MFLAICRLFIFFLSINPYQFCLWFVGVQPLQDIDEVNMFKDDNTVVHFKRP